VFSFIYAACKAHAPYYIVIRGLSNSTKFFPHCLINGTNFGKKVIEHKMCVLFLVKLCLKKVSYSKQMSALMACHGGQFSKH
jgi:hypothetical protein